MFPYNQPPAFWRIFCEQTLQASPRLARDLWPHFCRRATPVMLWQLGRCNAMPTPEAITRFVALCPPELWVDIAEELTKPGKPRPRELVRFEANVLAWTNRQGGWK